MDARLRVGNTVTGWVGAPADTVPDRFTGTVAAASVTGGRLVLTLSGLGTRRPPDGAKVTVMASPPSPHTLRAGRARYARLYAARRSWLTTGRTPTPTRRDVPLEVLVAGADDT